MTVDLVERARGLRELIESEADRSERERHQSPVTTKAMSDAGLYRMAILQRSVVPRWTPRR